MLLTLNTDTNTLVVGPGCTTPVFLLEARRGDGEDIQLQLLRSGEIWEAPGVAQFVFVAKRPRDFDGPACAMAPHTAFAFISATQRYEAAINYVTTELNKMLQIGSDPEAERVDLMAQVAWRPSSSASWRRSQFVRLDLENAVWRGDETVPGGEPSEPGGGPYLRPAVIAIAADVTNNNATANTLADITDLAFPVEAGKTYHFRFHILYTAAATTTGARFTINGPSSPDVLAFNVRNTLTSTTEAINHGTAYGQPATPGATSLTAGNFAVIEGIIKPTADGEVIAQFSSEVSGSAIVAKAGSSVAYTELG